MTTLSAILSILVILGSIYSLLSLVCVLGFFSGPPGETAGEAPDAPAVSILKPVKGLDPACSENLLSFCAQDYPRYEVLFGFREPDDPAVPIVADVVSRARCDARMIIGGEGLGPNQKVLNLLALAGEARYPLLALSDSDMTVDKDYLKRVVSEFRAERHTGLVTSLYKVSAPRSFGSAFESLTIALDFIPSVLVARRLEGVTFGLGASILVSKEALSDIGGFGPIADYLADDYQLGFRLWKKGYRNIISRHVIENRVGPMNVATHAAHQLRWARTYRASRPKGFIGYGVTHIFPYGLLLCLIDPGAWSLVLMGLVLGLRCSLALVIYRKVIGRRDWLKWLFLLPAKDVLGFLVWLWSFTGSKVSWRGTTYRVRRGGGMVRS